MTATAHALVGGAIAASVKDPALGLSLSALSHPLMDLIPHWDFALNWRSKSKVKLFLEAVVDLGGGTLLSYLLFGRFIDIRYFLAAVLLSEVWDIAEAPHWFLKKSFPPFSWIYAVQSRFHSRAKLPLGGITQALTVLFILLLIKFLT
ncbi:MAG: hypothetical protein Q7S44_03060 [bacterium]|nr:hypothetical protein [bacterium]